MAEYGQIRIHARQSDIDAISEEIERRGLAGNVTMGSPVRGQYSYDVSGDREAVSAVARFVRKATPRAKVRVVRLWDA